MQFPTTIRGAAIRRDGTHLYWSGGAAVCADGSPRCYSPPGGPGHIDVIGNAHVDPHDLTSPWCGVVLDAHGQPVVQQAPASPAHPCPGCYVSPTAGQREQYPVDDCRRYLDAEVVRYLVVNEKLLKKHGGPLSLGDVVRATFHGVSRNGQVGEVGPGCCEISVCFARDLGIPASPVNGGVDEGVTYEVWPDSAPSKPFEVDQAWVDQRVAGLASGPT